MKKEDILITNEVLPVHQQLSSMIDTAYYDLNVLREIKKRRYKEITARGIQRIIESSENGTHQAYQMDTISGTVTHKFSSAYYRPLHEAVRFASQSQTKLVPLKVTPTTPLWHWLIASKPNSMKKLFPRYKKSKNTKGIFPKVTVAFTEADMDARGLTPDIWWQRQMMAAISFNFISAGFFAAGIDSFIVVSSDMFLIRQEDLQTAFTVIQAVANNLELEDFLFVRTEK